MADLFARMGTLLVVITFGLPNEVSDTVLDGLSLALIVYGSILSVSIIADLFDIDLLGTGEQS